MSQPNTIIMPKLVTGPAVTKHSKAAIPADQETKSNINTTLFYLHASINGKDITMLVNLGASHNFTPVWLV